MSSASVCIELDFMGILSYRESTAFMSLQDFLLNFKKNLLKILEGLFFPLLFVISYGENRRIQ